VSVGRFGVTAPDLLHSVRGETKARVAAAYEGKKLLMIVTAEESGRLKGSERYKSLEIIEKAGKAGIAVAEYIAKGGTAKFIPWFVRRKQAKLFLFSCVRTCVLQPQL
jgi:hypothetical protein